MVYKIGNLFYLQKHSFFAPKSAFLDIVKHIFGIAKVYSYANNYIL